MIYITECPRDAMQGLHHWVPTELKVQYLQQLLAVGFDRLDFGSFVSPKAIPQLADTAEVLAQLDLSQTKTKLLAIIANQRGAAQALAHDEIAYLGFPLSVSESFQQRNTNKSISQAMDDVQAIQQLCLDKGKRLQVYLGMAFGNPYGDAYSPELVAELAGQLVAMGITDIALADTIGVSSPENVKALFKTLFQAFPQIPFSAHLHATPARVVPNVAAAYEAGVRHFDTALKGYGGCPMATDELTGNVATELVMGYFSSLGVDLHLNQEPFMAAMATANQVFVPAVPQPMPVHA